MHIFWTLLAAATLAMLTSPALAQEGRTRHYFIAAEEMIRDYAPSGRSLMPHGSHRNAIPLPWRGNTKWKKVRYVEYTDDTFTTRKPQPVWLGVMGPMLRAEVGDTMIVHFWNRARRHYHYHVADHVYGGMVATYTIAP